MLKSANTVLAKDYERLPMAGAADAVAKAHNIALEEVEGLDEVEEQGMVGVVDDIVLIMMQTEALKRTLTTLGKWAKYKAKRLKVIAKRRLDTARKAAAAHAAHMDELGDHDDEVIPDTQVLVELVRGSDALMRVGFIWSDWQETLCDVLMNMPIHWADGFGEKLANFR